MAFDVGVGSRMRVLCLKCLEYPGVIYRIIRHLGKERNGKEWKGSFGDGSLV